MSAIENVRRRIPDAAREPALAKAVVDEARKVVPESVIEDAVAGVALMGMNNVVYRFRHYLA